MPYFCCSGRETHLTVLVQLWQRRCVDGMQVRRFDSVLVVDDNCLCLSILRRALLRLGTAVETASTEDAARRYVRERHFDLAIVDYYLGASRGIDLILELRDIDPTLTAVIYSAVTTESVVRDTTRRGVQWFDKWTTLREVIRRLEHGDVDDACVATTPPATAKQARRRFYVEAVAANGGCVSVAARAIQQSRSTVQRNIRPPWLVEAQRDADQRDDFDEVSDLDDNDNAP